jgi:surface antigen Omp85-like protein
MTPAIPIAAQDTRQAQIEAEQADKATRLRPYEPTRAEQLLQRVEEALATPPTAYVWLGTVYPGGLFGAGPGLRLRYGGTGTFDVHAGVTLKNYKIVATRLRLPEGLNHRVRVDVHANWIDAPKVAFYGVGNDTRPRDRVRYLFRPATVGAGAQFKPVRFVSVGGDLDYLNIESRASSLRLENGRPLIDPSAAALDLETTYLRGHAFGMLDWRESPGYTRSGGMYRIDGWIFDDRNEGRSSFRRIDGEASHFIPILRGNWVIALNALASVTTTRAGDEVPYFLLPDLGGGSELRGYPSERFRDRNRILLTGEYRWTPSHYIDMAIFYSAGKVAAAARDLDLQGLKTSFGGGIRFHTPTATVLRIELARTREGTGLVFAFSPIF